VVLAGGGFCAIFGPCLGAIISVILAGGLSVEVMLFIIPVGLFVAGPFGFFAGSLGTWWLSGRSQRDISNLRLRIESASLGALIGAAFPLQFALMRLSLSSGDPDDDLCNAHNALIGALVGTICACLLAWWMRRNSLPLAGSRES